MDVERHEQSIHKSHCHAKVSQGTKSEGWEGSHSRERRNNKGSCLSLRVFIVSVATEGSCTIWCESFIAIIRYPFFLSFELK
jgi:hypothetical protein